jgi:ADP-ribose pyrophosphatase YjhB (NUDIX family)
MGKYFFADDPTIPDANELIPAASVIVVDPRGRLLMQRREGAGYWSLPGGGMEIGETIADCAVRETKEETDVEIEIIGITGLYSAPGHKFVYDDGRIRQEFSVCFLGRPVGGEANGSAESREVRWFPPEELEALPMTLTIRLRVDDWRFGRMPAIR